MLKVDKDIEAQLAGVPIGTIDAEQLRSIRAADVSFPTSRSDAVEHRDHLVPGDPGVLLRVYRPAGVHGDLPCLYAIHGGGFVLGSYEMEDARFDAWCPKYACVGVSVQYRLAPETPFPGPLEDCYTGLQWVFDHHRELGIDPQRIGIGGTSAGGGLAAGLALLTRDRGELSPRFQLLDCPMLDDRQRTPSSQLDGLPIWDRHSNTFGWRSYLGDLYGAPDVPAYAAPARATDLSNLPEAYVCVGSADGFRDEDIDYAMRLNQAGVPTELHVHPGAPHGVQLFADTPVAQRYAAGIESWLSRHL